MHYKEYLVGLINKSHLDPVYIMYIIMIVFTVRMHYMYKEYLVGLINKSHLDPVYIMYIVTIVFIGCTTRST